MQPKFCLLFSSCNIRTKITYKQEQYHIQPFVWSVEAILLLSTYLFYPTLYFPFAQLRKQGKKLRHIMFDNLLNSVLFITKLKCLKNTCLVNQALFNVSIMPTVLSKHDMPFLIEFNYAVIRTCLLWNDSRRVVLP